MDEHSLIVDRIPICRVCGRNDMKILSNGLCVRCDDVKFGYHGKAPAGWPEPSQPQIVTFENKEGEKDGKGKQ